jgi:esterase/lipase
VFPSDAHAIHDNLASDDKELRFMTGDHYLEEPGDARDVVADLIVGWLQQRGV